MRRPRMPPRVRRQGERGREVMCTKGSAQTLPPAQRQAKERACRTPAAQICEQRADPAAVVGPGHGGGIEHP
eukprot:4235810-Pyramimonas_sp.AAC.1